MVIPYTHAHAYIYPSSITLDCAKQLIAIRSRNADYTTLTVYDQQDGFRVRTA